MNARKRTVFVAPAVMAFTLMTGAGPAIAAPGSPDDNSSCVAVRATGKGTPKQQVAENLAQNQFADDVARNKEGCGHGSAEPR